MEIFDIDAFIKELKNLDLLVPSNLLPDDDLNKLLIALGNLHPQTLRFIAQKCRTVHNIQQKGQPLQDTTNKHRPTRLDIPKSPKTPGIISPTGDPYKVVPCRYFTTEKGCREGKKCQFSHDENERVRNKEFVYGRKSNS